MSDIKLKIGDYLKLPDDLKSSAKTLFNYGKIKDISGDEQIIEVILIDDIEVDRQRLHSTIERRGRTFSFLQYDIHY